LLKDVSDHVSAGTTPSEQLITKKLDLARSLNTSRFTGRLFNRKFARR
jgi:hypothetical protein